MPPKLYIKTYGCQMNEYDSKRIQDLLIETHHVEPVDAPEDADIILLNTCSIREKAQDKVFSDLGRYRKIKAKKPSLIIGVGGCVATQEREMIFKRAPYVDIVFGPQTLHRLPEMLLSVESRHIQCIDVSFPEIEKFDKLPEPKVDGATACVTIMEGCSKKCAYCIVPYVRGKEISRPMNDVLKEIESLAKQQVKEVTLLGQNVNAYKDGEKDLADLLYKVAKIDGVERIRFMTSHPLHFGDRLIEAFAKIPKLVDHLHLPVQSGSDSILKAMRRGYTAETFIKKVDDIRKVRPNISISSDFIVGFPGETEEDFQATIDLVRKIKFDHSFSFIYSPRPGTPAEKLQDNVSLDEKKDRLVRLQNLLNEQAAEISQGMIGSIQRILVTGAAKKHEGHFSGRTENNRIVNFKGSPEMIDQLIEVRITEAQPNSLRGEPATGACHE